MQTILFKINFSDGREFRVFCANSNQINQFRKTVSKIEASGGKVEVLTNGIHNIKQWREIVSTLNK